MAPLLHECLAEAIGTGFIVIFGVGSVCCAVLTGALQGLLQVALVWAIAVALAIYATGAVSGAHLNPAVSLALAAWRPEAFPRRKLVPYVAAQMAGAVAAGCINLAVFGELFDRFDAKRGCRRGEPCSVFSAMAFGEYAPNPGAFGADWANGAPDFAGPHVVLLVEAWGTFVLMYLILALTNPAAEVPKAAQPPLIGLAVAALIACYAPITQAGWNPARDLGPRLVAWAAGYGKVALPGPRSDFWAYVVGPCLGALCAVPVYDRTLGAGLRPADVELSECATDASGEPCQLIEGKCVRLESGCEVRARPVGKERAGQAS